MKFLSDSWMEKLLKNRRLVDKNLLNNLSQELRIFPTN